MNQNFNWMINFICLKNNFGFFFSLPYPFNEVDLDLIWLTEYIISIILLACSLSFFIDVLNNIFQFSLSILFLFYSISFLFVDFYIFPIYLFPCDSFFLPSTSSCVVCLVPSTHAFCLFVSCSHYIYFRHYFYVYFYNSSIQDIPILLNFHFWVHVAQVH